MVKVLCSNFCIACRRPLTRRYMLYQFRRRNGYFSRTRNRTSPV
nr:hypothetical protein [Vibrio vulnificus]